ncbi:hypothetical protein BDW74DRAFT_154792, partial [Aspergillus multicolor]|uniref:uncharacterized protein n=1 Tax=Aspergillus multicolor TaxID=41759 RepID=UPI003CCDF4BA
MVDFSNITHISLSYSNGAIGLRNLIRGCTRLESFSYAHSDAWSQLPLDPQLLYGLLCKHKATLQELQVHHYWSDDCDYDYSDESGKLGTFFGSLLESATLKRLRISAYNLLGWDFQLDLGDSLPLNHLFDVLPTSIQSLIALELTLGEPIAMKQFTKQRWTLSVPRVNQSTQSSLSLYSRGGWKLDRNQTRASMLL